MQSVSQAYSSQVYLQVQNGSSSPVNGKEADKTIFRSHSPLSQQSTDDSITLSAEGRQRAQGLNNTARPGGYENQTQTSLDKTKEAGSQTFSKEEMTLVKELQKRDTEVRAHEQAHLTAAGQYAAGRASYAYTTGPNGKRYAVGGEVPIDIGKEQTPEATIQKMRTVQRAALAPASPSSADRSIAAQASATESQAMKELLEQAEMSFSNEISIVDRKADATQETQVSDSSKENIPQESSSSPQISNFSRRLMTSAYQAIAEITS